MDHIFVREAYRVWHGAPHLDDALQAPLNRDENTINQKTRYVDIHVPDGKPDVLQQIENEYVIPIAPGYIYLVNAVDDILKRN